MKTAAKRQGGAPRDVFLTVRVDPETHAALLAQALENERTLAGEIRLALKRYLERDAS